jgi:hypothetical protein
MATKWGQSALFCMADRPAASAWQAGHISAHWPQLCMHLRGCLSICLPWRARREQQRLRPAARSASVYPASQLVSRAVRLPPRPTAELTSE